MEDFRKWVEGVGSFGTQNVSKRSLGFSTKEAVEAFRTGKDVRLVCLPTNKGESCLTATKDNSKCISYGFLPIYAIVKVSGDNHVAIIRHQNQHSI